MMLLEYEVDEMTTLTSPSSPQVEQQHRNCMRRSSMKSIGSSSRSLESGPLQVSFNPNAELVFIETVKEYTPDEIVSAYYQPHEYKQIKAENRILTRDLKERQLAPQNDSNNVNEDMEMEVCYLGGYPDQCINWVWCQYQKIAYLQSLHGFAAWCSAS